MFAFLTSLFSGFTSCKQCIFLSKFPLLSSTMFPTSLLQEDKLKILFPSCGNRVFLSKSRSFTIEIFPSCFENSPRPASNSVVSRLDQHVTAVWMTQERCLMKVIIQHLLLLYKFGGKKLTEFCDSICLSWF